jgi:hypothetical protein
MNGTGRQYCCSNSSSSGSSSSSCSSERPSSFCRYSYTFLSVRMRMLQSFTDGRLDTMLGAQILMVAGTDVT